MILKEKAFQLVEKLGIKSFNASLRWITNFKKRYTIVFEKKCVESASVNWNVCTARKD